TAVRCKGSTEQARKPKPGHGIRTAIRENWPVLSDGLIIQARTDAQHRLRESNGNNVSDLFQAGVD
ncbi:hypothetical protein CF026_09325, partial [Klebsiella michiganensis]|nr:hypothetical protein [Klebsiella michiganensis]MBW5998394.1 hypothetical protein [Klebsiella michiganensis]